MQTVNTIQPFQQLYTHVRARDPKLFEALDKMASGLVATTSSIDSIAFSAAQLYGKFAGKPSPSANTGLMYFATDYKVLYISNGSSWIYIAGTYSSIFSNRPTSLTINDAGFEFYSTDWKFLEYWSGTNWIYRSGEAQTTYGIGMTTLGSLLSPSEVGLIASDSTYLHRFQWLGTGWSFAAGESSQYYVLGPTVPIGGVWYQCDGNTHFCSNPDGTTLSSVPTQNINSTKAAILGGGYSTTKVLGLPPTWSANTNTGTDTDSGTVVTPGSGATVANFGHVHQYATNGANAPINIPSETNGGLPDHYTISMYLRA
jgi:hypothetical protein